MNIEFKQPKTLDGKQLIDELAQAGIIAADLPNIDAKGKMWIDIDAKDEAKATAIVAAHVAIPYVDPNADAKAALLAKLGITAAEAKLLLQ